MKLEFDGMWAFSGFRKKLEIPIKCELLVNIFRISSSIYEGCNTSWMYLSINSVMSHSKIKSLWANYKVFSKDGTILKQRQGEISFTS